MVMATSGITASLFWAQNEWAGPRRHHAASLKSPSLSTAAMALVLPWLVVPPRWGDASNVFLCQCLQITGVICTQDVQRWRHRAIVTQRDHLHCKTHRISLKTTWCRQSLPPTAGLLSGPLVATQATAQTTVALPELPSAAACACLSPRNILSLFGQALKDGKTRPSRRERDGKI